MTSGGCTLAIDIGRTNTVAAVAYHDRKLTAQACQLTADKRHTPGSDEQRGQSEVPPVYAVQAVLREVRERSFVAASYLPAARLCLTYPARWSEQEIGELREVARLAGYPQPTLICEPVAAATYYGGARLAAGDLVAVCDCGGGSVDVAVLERVAVGFNIVAHSTGREGLSGEGFTDLAYEFLVAQLPPDRQERLRAPRDAESQEQHRLLRHEAQFAIQLVSWGAEKCDVRLVATTVTRAEILHLLEDGRRAIVELLADTIAQAGAEPSDVAAIYLAGEASETPGLNAVIEERFGQPPISQHVAGAEIALGAARAALEFAAGEQDATEQPVRVPDGQVRREPACRMPIVGRDHDPPGDRPDVLMTHSDWSASRKQGRWSPDHQFPFMTWKDFVEVSSHQEIFELLDEADRELGTNNGGFA